MFDLARKKEKFLSDMVFERANVASFSFSRVMSLSTNLDTHTGLTSSMGDLELMNKRSFPPCFQEVM